MAVAAVATAAVWTVRKLVYVRVEVEPSDALMDAICACASSLHLRVMVMDKVVAKPKMRIQENTLYRVKTPGWSGFVTRRHTGGDAAPDSPATSETPVAAAAPSASAAPQQAVLVFFVKQRYVDALHTFVKAHSGTGTAEVTVQDDAVIAALVDYIFQESSEAQRRDFQYKLEPAMRCEPWLKDLVPGVQYAFRLPGTGLRAVAVAKTAEIKSAGSIPTLYGRGPHKVEVTVSLLDCADKSSKQCLLELSEGLRAIRDTRPAPVPGGGGKMINMYLPPGKYDGTWAWQFQADRTYARPVHTLAYAGTILQDLFADIERFLGDGAGKYAAAGVAHRRGYLLYGPPGCGKTSLIRAIAAYFNLGLCILDLKGRSKKEVHTLMQNAPDGTAIVAEDVDLMFADATATAIATDTNTISVSDLLNVLDGVFVGKTRLLFMTTNNVGSLGPAALRAGRCDNFVHLGPLQEDQVRAMATCFFPDATATAVEALATAIRPLLGTMVPASLQNLLLKASSVEDAVAQLPSFMHMTTVIC